MVPGSYLGNWEVGLGRWTHAESCLLILSQVAFYWEFGSSGLDGDLCIGPGSSISHTLGLDSGCG